MPTLLPVYHPLFNLREICKQMVLLEDHLLQERKRCEDCTRKHFLTLEALAEEAGSLDETQKWVALYRALPDQFRALSEQWLDGVDPLQLAQALRRIRKELLPVCFDMRQQTQGSKTAATRMSVFAEHVASIWQSRQNPCRH